jgi:hypothetical protein
MVTMADLADVCGELSNPDVVLEAVAVDQERHAVSVRLVVPADACADCVLPADHIERLIRSVLARRFAVVPTIRLLDDRVTTRPVTSVPAATVEVLDPTVPPKAGDPDPGPPAGALAGRRLLFRVDVLWKAWDAVVDEWTALLAGGGVEVTTWRRQQGLAGAEAAGRQAEYEAKVREADVVVSGLANCGSCSAWTVRDALTALGSGLPTVAVATEQFAGLAHLLAQDGHRPGLRVLTLPYPLEPLPEPRVRQLAREAFPALLATLEATV